MKKYASDTPEARELVGELEFVWDQVKNNSRQHSASHSLTSNTFPSTTTIPGSSNGQQQHPQGRMPMLQMQMHYPVARNSPPPSPTSAPLTKYRQEPSRPPDYILEQGYQSSGDYEHLINPGQPYYEHSRDTQEPQQQQRYLPLRRMKVGSRGTRSIQSQSVEDDGGNEEGDEAITEQETGEEDDDDDDDELFQVPNISQRTHPRIDQDDDDYEHLDEDGFPSRLIMGRDTSPDMGTMRWQLRVERALTKMSAEIAALREQLEVRNAHVLQHSGSWFWPGTGTHSGSTGSVARRKSGEVVGAGGGRKWGRMVWQVIWNVCRHLMVDAVVVGIVVWWMGRRGDERRAGEIWRWLTRVLGRRRRRGEGGGGGVGLEGGGGV